MGLSCRGAALCAFGVAKLRKVTQSYGRTLILAAQQHQCKVRKSKSVYGSLPSVLNLNLVEDMYDIKFSTSTTSMYSTKFSSSIRTQCTRVYSSNPSDCPIRVSGNRVHPARGLQNQALANERGTLYVDAIFDTITIHNTVKLVYRRRTPPYSTCIFRKKPSTFGTCSTFYKFI
jgi:hypothetical protein